MSQLFQAADARGNIATLQIIDYHKLLLDLDSFHYPRTPHRCLISSISLWKDTWEKLLQLLSAVLIQTAKLMVSKRLLVPRRHKSCYRNVKNIIWACKNTVKQVYMSIIFATSQEVSKEVCQGLDIAYEAYRLLKKMREVVIPHQSGPRNVNISEMKSLVGLSLDLHSRFCFWKAMFLGKIHIKELRRELKDKFRILSLASEVIVDKKDFFALEAFIEGQFCRFGELKEAFPLVRLLNKEYQKSPRRGKPNKVRCSNEVYNLVPAYLNEEYQEASRRGEQSSADHDIYTDDESDLINEVHELSKLKHDYVGWVFAFINIILEALSAYLDQVASPRKFQYALTAMLICFVAVALSIVEFIHKAQNAHAVLRRRGWKWWFFHPDDKPFGAFADIFGLICGIFQCFFTIIQCAYHLQHADSPIKISVLPLIFAICAAGSRFFPQDREPLPYSYMPLIRRA